MRLPVALICLIVLTLPVAAAAQADRSGFALQAFGGFVLNLPTTLKIEQTGQPPLEFRAEWETRPLEQPFYWAVRARWRRADDGFEVQLLHHKMILKNPPPEIDNFEVTHGFNTVTAHYVKTFGWWDARLGAGVVVPHPDSEVRGGYHEASDYVLGGPVLMAGAGSEYVWADHLLLAAELQFVAGWATVTVHDGRAEVTAVGLHLLLGAGYRF
jgi:hypothetical protein